MFGFRRNPREKYRKKIPPPKLRLKSISLSTGVQTPRTFADCDPPSECRQAGDRTASCLRFLSGFRRCGTPSWNLK